MRKIILIQDGRQDMLKLNLNFQGVLSDVARNEFELVQLMATNTYDAIVLEPLLPKDFLLKSEEETKDVTMGGVGLNIFEKITTFYKNHKPEIKTPKIIFYTVMQKNELIYQTGFPKNIICYTKITKTATLAEEIKKIE